MRNKKGQFVKGHNKGVKRTPEVLAKMKANHRGFGGKKHTEEAKRKIGEKSKGRPAWNKEKELPNWIKQRISQSLLGRKIPKEQRERQSKTMKGRKFSEEHKRNISKNHHNVSLEKNPKWLGGKSFEPYTIDWTETLKTSIRERDKFTCQICGEKQGDRLLSVHHIDYNKNNCDPKNLISLCLKCHNKTSNNRDYWRNLLCKK
jgi:5-methylcytosine-specific restriction endonuclease McrA